MYKQLVLVEFHNCSPFVYEIVSEQPITIERVWKYFQEKEDLDEERDGITFVDEVTQINIDNENILSVST